MLDRKRDEVIRKARDRKETVEHMKNFEKAYLKHVKKERGGQPYRLSS